MFEINPKILNKTVLGTGNIKVLRTLQLFCILILCFIPFAFSVLPVEIILGGGVFWIVLTLYLTFFSKRYKAIFEIDKGLQAYNKNDFNTATYHFRNALFIYPDCPKPKGQEILKDWVNQLEKC